MKRTLVLLTLNEIEGVTELFDRIPFDAADESLVVDGGSTDGTVEFFTTRGVKVVGQEKKGRAEAFRVAFDSTTGDVLCFFSPDGNEDPADIPRLFEKIEAGADMAIARRFGEGARNEEDDSVLRWRAWANQAFTLLANLAFNLPKLVRERGAYVQDTINGYRAITREAFRRLSMDAEGFLVEYQMTMRALKLGMKIVEIPTIEHDRIGGQSTASSLPTGLRFVRGLAREIVIGRRF
ncbi:MAG: glycosyltransferase [Polyangiaceae bacterium]|nr:glycosyltransferase [Polyangiaceae bacterium]